MPIYDVQAPDGKIYSVEAPEGTPQEQIFGFVTSQMGRQGTSGPDFSRLSTAELEAMPSAPTSISDIARSLGIGVVGGAKAVTDVFGAGSSASEYLGETVSGLQKGLTPARQAEIAKRQEMEKRAAESGDTLKEISTFLGGVAEAPLQSLVQGVGSSAPTLLASLAAIPAGAPAGLALGVGVISRYALGAAQGVGELKGSILDAVEQEYKNAGYSPEKAKELAIKAQEYSADKAFELGGAALLGALDAFTGIESGVSKAAKAAAAKRLAGETLGRTVEGLPEKALARPGVLGSAVRSAIGEAPVEGAQGGFGEYATNLALIKEGLLDPELAMQGVFGAAARDAAVGALTGTAFTPIEQANRMREYKLDQALRQQQDAALAVSEEELAQRFPNILPGGFKIEREELGREMGPEGYSIMAEGREEPLSVVDTQEEADAKLASLTKIRAEERDNLLKEEGKINADIQKAKDKLERLEATEQTDTDEYRSLKAEFPTMADEAAQKIKNTYDRIESLSKPLSIAPFGEKERINEQFNVIGPDNQPVGSFKTLEQAEGVVEQAVGEDTFKQEKQNKEAAKYLYKTFVPQMRKFGLGDVGLSIVEKIENGAGGAYLNKLIKISLEEANPIQTMRHEALHALKDLGFFTPQQWKVLEERAKKQWLEEMKTTPYTEGVSRYDAYVNQFKQEGESKGLEGAQLDQYVNEALVEEAIADAFGAFDKGAKPPPGMIAALVRKIKNFFASLSQALRGSGFQSAEDIFQAVERGEVATAKTKREAKPKVEEAPEAEEKRSLKRPAVAGEIEISTQNPSGPKRTYDPIAQMLSIDEKAVMEAMKANPDYRRATINALKSYGFIPQGIKNKDVIELFKNNIVDNLLYLYNLVPENIRKRSKLWYDGANKISEQMAKKYGLSLRQVSAIMAAMSPQKDWFQNVSMGERAIDILTKQSNRSWTPEMLQYAESYVKETKDRAEREKRQDDFEKIKRVAEKGTVLQDMDIKSAAAFIRAYDEAFHSRQYRIVTPEGGFGEIVTNNDGTPSTMMWSTYGPIEKAVSIFRDGSRDNVSEQLGFEHKIRSFYNNIAAPNSDLEHVTIDTHAVAAALFEALAGTDPEVVQNFGGTGKTTITGVGGTYGLIADAYREAARRVGVQPREMQSITWEAVRGLFNEDIKSSIKEPIKAEWAKYKSGEQSFAQTRQNIIEISRNKRTNDKGVDIPPPDWVGSGKGQFVEDGGESYDKSYVPTGGVRLREEQEIRDKLTFNLSAVTNSIPGLRELYARALKRDEKAVEVLQGVAEASLNHLLSGTGAKVKITRAKGVYLSDREPSLMVSVSFNESESKDVLAALARFAKNFNQEQIHVRMPTKKKVGFDYGDGSYVTPVYTIPLKKELSDKAISAIIDKSGLKGFTVTSDSLTAYFVRPAREEGESNEQYAKRINQEFDRFKEETNSAHVLVGKKGEGIGRRAERLFVYGSGYGAEIDYESISGNVLPQQGADTVTPRLIAEYLTGEPVQAFKQKDLTRAQVAEQQKLAQVFDSLPVNDLKNPLVKKAYKALTKALKEQFAVLPIKVELQTETDKQGNILPPYDNNSAAMRRDILERNHILVYPTTPETFGPEGYDFSGHPLLEDSGFKDINGKPMLFNDVLRAVHDYFAHGMSEAQFGPKGEFTAWRNHMASTSDPMARWALTAETRMQNAWQNFSAGAQNIPLKDRPFALQKAALPPVEFLYTGDKTVDLPVAQMQDGLSDKDKQGSKPAKLSLRTTGSPAFKEWFGKSKIVNKDGTPMVMYHGLAKDTTDFTRKTKRGAPIFLTDDPEFAQRFAVDSYESVARNPQDYLSKEQIADGVKKAIAAIRKDYGKDSLGMEMIESLKTGNIKDATPEAQEYLQKEFINLLPTGPHIMPLYVRAERPFDYENPEHVKTVTEELNKTTDSYGRKLGNKLTGFIATGDWETVELGDVQDAIKEMGFDSFYVKENGRKNLAVYNPNQVKSATANVGTYSLESPDVRYSLRGVAFPTVKEAKEAAEAVSVPDTPAFKLYIAGSQWLDEDGKAKKFYHATTGNFFEFLDGTIYLSESAEESEKWGRMAEDRLRGRVYKALNKDEKIPFFQQAVDQAVADGDITKDQGEGFMRDIKRKIPEFGDYDIIKKQMDDVLLSLSPDRMKIMPLYARAMMPFDFRNKEHVQRLMQNYNIENLDRTVSDEVRQFIKETSGGPTVYVDDAVKGLKGLLPQGYESIIERPDVMQAIRRAGFDGYLVRRNRTAPISYAVFSPRQVKSVTANEGPYSLESKDIRYSLRKFNKDDLPTKKKVYVLPADTLIYHGAYKERADQIEKTGGVLLSRPPMKVSGGLINEGGLIFFGGEETAKNFAESKADPITVQASIKAGIERLSGKVFETMTDRPYRLINRYYEVNAAEAEALNKALGLPDYKQLRAGSSLQTAASRADDFDNSNIDRYEVIGSTGKKQSISAPWPVILRTLNMDGFFDDFSIALTANNGIRLIGEDGKLEKFSLPNLSTATRDRMNEVAPQRYTPTWKERVIGLFKQDFTALRQAALNRYETLAVYDKRLREIIRRMGGPDLLADQSAEFAALQSDLSAGVAASAIGIGDRAGGVPVYRNGVTTIDTSVKGLVESLAPLAKYGDPEIYQRYQFWAGWKRGRRLLREGREQVYTPADAALAQEIENAHPEFISVQRDLTAFNNGIVNYAVQTGVLSRERARVYTQYADYIPFYRQLELDRTIGPNPFSGISGQRGPRELRGGESALGDFMENMVRNTQSMINSGMKNAAAQRATNVALQINEVARLPGPATGIGVDTYTLLENGNLVYYRANDKLFIDALASLNMPDLPFIGFLSAPANVLRNLVTKDPGFMMANLLRDSLSAYVTSGQNVTPVVGTMVNFGKALSGKDKNLQALFNAGVVGGYEFSQNIQQSGKTLSSDLNKKAGKDAIALRPFKYLWEGLEKGTTASDAATRMAVYERVMQETGNEAEAISRALEVMNFNRKGNNVLIRLATAALPFFNARLQGLDLFYRASTGQMNAKDAQEIKRRFWVRGATMMALSAMAYLAVAGDDEYERQEEETKDNNWIIPALGIRIPIPFEVGTLFKTIPERLTAYLMGNNTGKDLRDSTLRALANTFAFNPIPQTFKPIIEVATNFNFFTMRPIVGQGMEDVAPQFQVGPGTSKTAEFIANILNGGTAKQDQLIKVSPMKVDQLIRGYTGTMGGYLVDVIDSMANEFSDIPKASKRFEQLPVVKRFALDPEARGNVTQFYEMQKSVDTFVRTANLLEKTARPEEYVQYLQDNIGLMAAKDYISSIEKEMKKLRDTKRIINSLDMLPDEKRDLLTDLGRLENNLTANIRTTKRAFSELK